MDGNQEAESILVLNQVEQHLKLYYYPAISVPKAALLMTTREIYCKMQELFPCPYYESKDIIKIMLNLGFKMADLGAMDYHWLLDYGLG